MKCFKCSRLYYPNARWIEKAGNLCFFCFKEQEKKSKTYGHLLPDFSIKLSGNMHDEHVFEVQPNYSIALCDFREEEMKVMIEFEKRVTWLEKLKEKRGRKMMEALATNGIRFHVENLDFSLVNLWKEHYNCSNCDVALHTDGLDKARMHGLCLECYDKFVKFPGDWEYFKCDNCKAIKFIHKLGSFQHICLTCEKAEKAELLCSECGKSVSGTDTIKTTKGMFCCRSCQYKSYTGSTKRFDCVKCGGFCITLDQDQRKQKLCNVCYKTYLEEELISYACRKCNYKIATTRKTQLERDGLCYNCFVKKANRCPQGYTFGEADGHDICDDCEIWDECSDFQEDK